MYDSIKKTKAFVSENQNNMQVFILRDTGFKVKRKRNSRCRLDNTPVLWKFSSLFLFNWTKIIVWKLRSVRKENQSIHVTSVGFNCIGRSSKSSPFSAAQLLPPIAISSVLLVVPPAFLLLVVDGDVILWLEAAAPWWLASVPSADARLISFWFLTKFKKTCKVSGIHCEHKRAPSQRTKAISLTKWLWQNFAQKSHRNVANWPQFTF